MEQTSVGLPVAWAQGHVYVGVPPLYKLEAGRKSQYCYTEEERKAATADLAPGSYHVQRFKVPQQGLPLYRHCIATVPQACYVSPTPTLTMMRAVLLSQLSTPLSSGASLGPALLPPALTACRAWVR